MIIHIGETIKSLRRQKELTQENLANFLGVSFQCISKWERGESYPDITMLPSIASFFGVTTDYLLGINEIEIQKRIDFYHSEYSRLWSENKIADVKDLMKKAVAEFPGNYELLVKYLNAAISVNSSAEYMCAVKDEIYSVYETICNNCTVDSIRIWAKKLMCRYLKNLSKIDINSKAMEKAEEVLSEMPLMQNARDYIAVSFYSDDKDKSEIAVGECISELLKMIGEVLFAKYRTPWLCDEKIIRSYLSLVEAIMPEEDFGKSFSNVVYLYGYIGIIEDERGNQAEAVKWLKKSLDLAKRYDEMDVVTVHTSEIVRGVQFNKVKTVLGNKKLADRIEYLIENVYPLSATVKNELNKL